MLWRQLKDRKIAGLKFRRQVPLDGYILDFVCFEARLIIEIDGSQHAENMSDMERDRHFWADGFCTLRFWNHEIEHDLDSVLQKILSRIASP